MDFFLINFYIIKMPCISIKKDGNVCNKNCGENERCGVHRNQIITKGPNETRRQEIISIYFKNIKNINQRWMNYEITENERERLTYEEKFRYNTELLNFNHRINEEIRLTGVNPDLQAIELRRTRRLFRMRERMLRQQNQVYIQAIIVDDLNPNQLNRVLNFNDQNQERPLEAFANDRQNVHKKETVDNVKKNIELILKIHVPDEYQTQTLKTIGEIILECNLSKKAAWQMTAKYCEDESIYEMEGIYPKVLNSLWQFIKLSEHNQDLKKILKSELEDNIGMCAQGNLSRLCNILNGYLEGFQFDTDSQIEKLGTELSKLIEIESYIERVDKAIEILKKFNIDQSEWSAWTDPLMDDDNETDQIIQKIPETNHVIELIN